MFTKSPAVDFTSLGLITDQPAHKLPPGAWSESLNIRAKDGSVQGVYAFADDMALWHAAGDIANGEVKAVCQFTPAGGDYLMIAYIVKRANGGAGSVILYDTAPRTGGAAESTRWEDVTNATANQVFTFDDKTPPQIFVFNELLIVNPGTDAPPQYTNAKVSAGSLQELPGWLYDVEGNAIDGITSAKFYTIISLGDTTQAQWEAAGLSSSVTAAVGVVFTAGSSMTIAGTGTVKLSNPIIARVVRPFNNRLVAMNIKEERGSSADVFLPIDFLWSSHITTIQSLTNATWSSSSTNTAGDAFMTQTPGKILDGMQLGPYFIAYKDDAVIQVRDTGDTFVLAFDTIFEDDGIYSPGCVATIGNNQHIVWGNYGVYMHDGQTQKVDIAKGIVQEDLFDSVLNTHRGRSFVFKQTRDKEVWFCYSETGNSGDGANKAFVFDYDTQIWHKRDIPQLLSLTETELDGVIKIYGASPDDANIQILSTSVYTSGGYFVQGENHLGTTDFKQLTSYYPDAEAQVLLAVDGTVNIGDTPTYTNQTFNPATSYKLDKRVSGRYMNVKVTMSGATNPKLTTVSFDLRGTARR